LPGTPASDEAADAATDVDDADQEEETTASDDSGTEDKSAAGPEPGPDMPDAASASASASGPSSALTALRLLLKTNRRGTGVSGEVGFLARSLGKSEPELLAALAEAGLVVPDDPAAKPVFVEHGAEIFWFNRNAKDGTLWLNAKASRASVSSSARRTGAGAGGKSGGSGGSRSRRTTKKSGPEEPAA
jgi:hypothetical protein